MLTDNINKFPAFSSPESPIAPAVKSTLSSIDVLIRKMEEDGRKEYEKVCRLREHHRNDKPKREHSHRGDKLKRENSRRNRLQRDNSKRDCIVSDDHNRDARKNSGRNTNDDEELLLDRFGFRQATGAVDLLKRSFSVSSMTQMIRKAEEEGRDLEKRRSKSQRHLFDTKDKEDELELKELMEEMSHNRNVSEIIKRNSTPSTETDMFEIGNLSVGDLIRKMETDGKELEKSTRGRRGGLTMF